MSQSDPTDHALAAIASILHQPEGHREPEAAPVLEDKPVIPAMVEADGYSKVGPGPITAIRFKWTVRRDDDGHFYVDETIGENSAPIVNGPMSGEAAVRLVDACESDARLRFERLRNEMTGRAAAAGLGGSDGGEV
ncbi:MAG: hypothetical protein KGK01_04350 [Bradyrhizobium sp.]|uniref:hypothetical protein n=1 Tax=Bradyrhizobium sp. TaxID=376 RepID=UPI00238DCF83|nr:hypothetical protein [Bradyrhizobium sp.]MDE2068878.1 hypothetical protein [Bradyrhizobium sp.]MDE2241688.1 hypothetical protein [Bradyrhizobium sp.]MDE2470396.1 hypothetical protein [Bradyrhizobium sp.]